jgi:AcrR family transcriptional regulator
MNPAKESSPAADPIAEPRDRILDTAYDLFARFGMNTIGVDRIVAEAGVAKMTLYRHFRSKEELVTAVLAVREERWTNEWLIRGVEEREEAPEARLLAMFDLFEEWFSRDSFEGCLFINSLTESHDRTSVVGAASAEKLEHVRLFVKRLAEELQAANAEDLSYKWQILLMGAITAARRGDHDAARRAQDVARLLLEREPS